MSGMTYDEMLKKAKVKMEADRIDEDAWYHFAGGVGKVVRCLPSLFASDNGHIVRAVEKVVRERDDLEKIAGELAGHLENFIDDHNQSCTCDYCTTLARWVKRDEEGKI